MNPLDASSNASEETLRSLWTYSVTHYHELWVLYVTVAFGTMGFAFTDTYDRHRNQARCILSIAFIAFAVGNFISLKHSSELQDAVSHQMMQSMEPIATLGDRILGTAWWKIVAMQGAGAAAVLVSLWKSSPSAAAVPASAKTSAAAGISCDG